MEDEKYKPLKVFALFFKRKKIWAVFQYLFPSILIAATVLLFIVFAKQAPVKNNGTNVNALTDSGVQENKLKDILPEKKTTSVIIAELQIINLIDRSGVGAFGNASREMKDGLFSATLVASLADPPKKFVYEGWLQRIYPYQMISMGRLSKNTQSRYSITFRQEKNLLDYDNVVITKEKDDDDPSPSDEIILEGSFEEH